MKADRTLASFLPSGLGWFLFFGCLIIPQTPAEFADAAAQFTAYTSQSPHAEEQNDDDKDNDEFGWTKAWHLCLP